MKKKFIVLISLLAIALCAAFTGILYNRSNIMKESIFFHENINQISFTNDLGITDIGDPFMLKISQNEYYLYCTSAENGFYCWHSRDMVNWSDKKMCYVKEADSWGKDSFWAPEVVAYHNQYYLYYTARNENGSLRIGLAVSDTPDGPFIDEKNEPLFDFGYAAIDGNVLIDDDGSKYLYYSKDCSENMVGEIHTSQIYAVPLSDDMKSVAGDPVFLTTPEQPWECMSGDYLWNEGPEVIKHDYTYYLTYSANYYASSLYSVGYATSKSPLGPFIKAEENPILTSQGLEDVSGTGHHSFVLSPDASELWIAYHSHTDVSNPSGDRKVNIARAGFTSDGKMYMNGPLTATQPMPSGSTVTNISGHFTASSNGKELQKLTDGIIQIHEEPSRTEFLSADKEGNVIISLSSDTKALEVSSIALYTGYHNINTIDSVCLCINEKKYSEKYMITEENTSPVILSFDSIAADTIDIIITPAGAEKEITLSEIELFQ